MGGDTLRGDSLCYNLMGFKSNGRLLWYVTLSHQVMCLWDLIGLLSYKALELVFLFWINFDSMSCTDLELFLLAKIEFLILVVLVSCTTDLMTL
jgi:hypothetical protein